MVEWDRNGCLSERVLGEIGRILEKGALQGMSTSAAFLKVSSECRRRFVGEGSPTISNTNGWRNFLNVATIQKPLFYLALLKISENKLYL